MIPNIPTSSAIFAALLAKSQTLSLKQQRAITVAMEAAAILAPFINRGVSWRTINESLYNTLDVLDSQGILSSEISSAMASSVGELNNVRNTVSTIQNLSSGDPNFLNRLDTLSGVLNSQTRSLSTNIATFERISSGNIPQINNTGVELASNLAVFGSRLGEGVSNISASIGSVTTFAQIATDLAGANSLVGAANISGVLSQVNQVQNQLQSAVSITNNIVGSVEQIKSMAKNIIKIKALFNLKRKGQKKLPQLPAFLDPKNSQYVQLYDSINLIINTLNATAVSLKNIPKIPFL